MNLLDKITLAVITAQSTTLKGNQDLDLLVQKISAILSAVIGALAGLGVLILGYRLIKDIILSKKEDNPDEEVAKYKKRISNTIIALVIVVVVTIVLETGCWTFIQSWLTDMLQK